MKLVAIQVVLFALLLGGCATTRNYESYLDKWVGKEKEELVSKMGQPDKIHSFVDGRKAYEYRFKDVYGGNMSAKARENASIPTGCTTFFFTDPETSRVLSWKWVGDGCLAK